MALPPNLITARKAKYPGVSMPKAQTAHFDLAGVPRGIVPQRWTLEINGWMPTPLNKLLGHWTERARRKKDDRAVIAFAVALCGIPAATRRRRVSLLIVLPPGKRSPDPDAFDKSLRDALVACGALKNDSAAWVEGKDVRYARGKELVSFVTLEDV